MPVGNTHIGQQAKIRDAGIVYKDIRRRYLGKHFFHGGKIAHIADVRTAGNGKIVFYFFLQFLQRFPVVETGNGEGHPLLGKLSGNGSPDSAGRTGDKHLFHGKTSFSFLLHIITHCGERYKSITLYSK